MDTGIVARAALALSMVGSVGTAAAADHGPHPHLYFGAYYLGTNKDRGQDDNGDGWQINGGLPLTEHLYLEAHGFFSTIETGKNAGTDFYQRGGGLDLQIAFGDRESFTPFILIGGGAIYNDVVPDALDETAAFGNAGLGFVVRLFDLHWLRLRGEGRYIYDDFQDGYSDFRVGGGIEVALATDEPPPPAEPPPPPLPPQPAVVAPPLVSMDTDRDGVADGYDQCPDTLPGARVDDRGCVIETQVVQLRNINFEFNSATLTASSQPVLDEAVRFLRAQPNVSAEIAGHTDSIGSDSYNQKLSQDRAMSVRNYLISAGIEPTRLSAAGYGESQPVASNDDEYGRQANRRVEFRINVRRTPY